MKATAGHQKITQLCLQHSLGGLIGYDPHGQISSFLLPFASQPRWCSALSRLSLFNFLPKFILSEHILIVLKNYFY